MSSYSYCTPKIGAVNRYWKRPKPRVYECNVRDAERFYQQSYKDYLEAKEYASKRASEDRSRIGDSSTSSWSVRRTTSGTDSVSRDIPDYESTSRSSYLNANSSRGYGEDGLSSSFRSSSISGSRNKSPESDMNSIEDRLQRLQKLRAELGLPTSDTSAGSSKVTFSIPSPTGSTTNLSRRRVAASPDPRDRRGKTVDASSTSSYSSSRGNRARAVEFSADTYGDKLSSGTERSSKYASKYSSEDSYDSKPKQNGFGSSYAKDESDKYSVTSSSYKSKKYDDDDDSYSYKPRKSRDTGESESFKSSRKAVVVDSNDLEDYDADAYLSSIKKKFPTSEEILERIKKMDSDM